ncbi:leucine rich repeat containing protein BspA family protein, partial [Entamoeba invadens IP1]
MNITLDAFNFQIVVKYFYFEDDFINSILICKKFTCILDRFQYNPISVTSNRLFPYMETQHLYTEKDVELPDMQKYVVWFTANYHNIKNRLNDSKYVYKNIQITKNSDDPNPNIEEFNLILQNKYINQYDIEYIDTFKLKHFSFPSHVTEILGPWLRREVLLFESVSLCESIKSIPHDCFNNCKELKTIDLPSTVTSIGGGAFSGCRIEYFTSPIELDVISSDTFT